MIDIHTHIIPNVDDGSKSIEESIEMIRHEIEIGVDTIYLTPHHIYHRYDKTVDEIKEQYNLLCEEVRKQNLNVNLLLGQEIYYTTRENILEKVKRGELLTLNNSDCVLLEFSYTEEPDELDEVIYNFSVNGYRAVIAHVERYKWINAKKIKALKREGALIQINADPIIKKTTLREHLFTKELLKNNLVDVIASDAHTFRPSNLNQAYKKVKNKDLFEVHF